MSALPGLARPAVAVALAFTVSACAPATAGRPPEAAPPSDRAAATVQPALVRVTGEFTGWVHDQQGVYANDGYPLTFTTTCSGFGVHPDGYLATAGYCVDPNDRTIRTAFLRAAAEEAAANRPDIPLEKWIEHARSTFTIEGQRAGSPIHTEIHVSGIAGTPSEGVAARVVDVRPIGEGDIGLLKVDVAAMPTLELATGAGLAIGTPLLAAGYPEAAGEVIQPDAQPSITNGAVTATHTDGGPVYEIDAALEGGVSGGPAVDSSGRVLGINSVRSTEDGDRSLVHPISGFVDLLGRNGASAELGPRDLLYRDALDAYDAGEYTDAIEAIERLQQEGSTHPRIAELHTDAELAREQYGDASENRRTQTLIWVGVAVGALLVVAGGVLLVMRRRRRAPVVVMGQSHPPFPPQFGAPWPGGPFPQPDQPMAPAGVPNQPDAPAMSPTPAVPQAPISAPTPPAADGPAPEDSAAADQLGDTQPGTGEADTDRADTDPAGTPAPADQAGDPPPQQAAPAGDDGDDNKDAKPDA